MEKDERKAIMDKEIDLIHAKFIREDRKVVK